MFIAGTRVAVMNRSYSGAPIFEGYAYITKILEQAGDGRAARAKVKFFNKANRLERETHERNLHKDWQSDPEAWVKAQCVKEGRGEDGTEVPH